VDIYFYLLFDGGHVSVLQWAHAQGAAMDLGVCNDNVVGFAGSQMLG